MSAIVSKNVIQSITTSFKESLEKDSDWCEVSKTSPQNADYGKPLYQKVYAMRYIPAYYFEYCILSSQLNRRAKKYGYEHLEIASLGCGLAPDYYALKGNLIDITFNYSGYDAVHWSTEEFMPSKEANFALNISNASQVAQETIDTYDVFFFPKSISDINDHATDNLEALAEKISSSKKERIFFLNSFISSGCSQVSNVVKLFGVVHNAMISKGFTTSDDHKKTFFGQGPLGRYLISIDSNFDYPPSQRLNCERRDNGKVDCLNCNVIKSPILRNNYIEYNLLEYIKHDN